MANFKKSGKSPVITIDFFIMLLLLGVFIFTASSKNTELRSKAASIERVVKVWEFKDAKGKDSLQGWVGKDITGIQAKDGVLVGVMPTKKVPVVELSNHSSVGTIPAGFKSISLRMMLQTPDGATLPDNVFPFSFPIIINAYEFDRREEATPPEETKIFVKLIPAFQTKATLFADGQFHEYTVNLPAVTSIRSHPVSKISIGFPDFYKYAKGAPLRMSVDWIKLFVSSNKPIPKDCTTASGSCTVIQ